MFVGFVALGSVIRVPFLFTNGALTPNNTTNPPTYRIYDPDSLVSGSPIGTLDQTDQKTIIDATNASPIVITTSANHNYQTGDRITIVNVGGNTAANNTFTITNVSATTFSLDGSTGNGAYTGGGTANVSGVYHKDVTASAGNGYESGKTYRVIAMGQISGTTHAFERTFTVV